MTCWDKVFDFVLRMEGGYSDHPSDRGDKINMGITSSTLDRAYAARIVNVTDVKALTKADAEKIYEVLYWKASRADRMPWSLCLVRFDSAVNHGVNRAGKLLQQTLNEICHAGLKVDGIVGRLTLSTLDSALKTSGVEIICEKYLGKRQAFYDHIVQCTPSQKVFYKGWINRLSALRKAACSFTIDVRPMRIEKSD